MLNQKFWERYFRVYDTLKLLIPYQELLETICQELKIKKEERVLDAGCGPGNLTIKIKQAGGQVVALDNCKEALRAVQKKDPEIKTVLADLTKNLPFPNNYFDKIVCNNVLYVMPKKQRLHTMREFYRVLKPKGKIVVSNPVKKANPVKIYLAHVKASVKKRGYIKTAKDIARMAIPTLKTFQFNLRIKKEKKDL